jgi:hypothetical protein
LQSTFALRTSRSHLALKPAPQLQWQKNIGGGGKPLDVFLTDVADLAAYFFADFDHG